MFWRILKFELKYRAVRPATYIYFIILGLLAYLFVLAIGQFFSGSNVSIGGVDGNVNVNSPYIINELISAISFFGVLIIAAVMGNPILRDFDHNTHTVLYSYPITKMDYLGGRFVGSFIVTIFILLGIGVGFYLATLNPGINQDKIGEFHLLYYIQPYLSIVIPNAIFLGAVFFSLATLTRNVLSIYIGSVLFIVLYSVAASFISDIENKTIAALVDPFGGFAVESETKYWSVGQRNSQLVPFTGLIILNRIIWTLFGIGLFALTFFRFKFSHFLSDKLKRIKRTKGKALKFAHDVNYQKLVIPKVNLNHSKMASIRKYLMLTRFEFFQIIKSVYFQAIVAAGLIVLGFISSQIGEMYGTTTYPVTYQVISMLSGSFYLFFLIIIIFYAGELIWKDRGSKIDELKDTLPVPSWMTYSSKISALIGIQVVLLMVIMLFGIVVQSLMGYFNFELHQYIISLSFIFIDLLLICVLYMTIQILVNQKFLGYFAVVIFYLFDRFFMNAIGLEHVLFDYGSDINTPYSDMNGYGHFLIPFFIFKVYWMSLAVVLACISNLFWVRGTDTGFSSRMKIAAKRLKKNRKLMFMAIILFISGGIIIYYNTNILNDYQTSDESKQMRADYENLYKKYEKVAQPRITDINVDLDIYPEERDFHFKGYFILENKTDEPIDSLHVSLNNEASIQDITFSRPFTMVQSDQKFMHLIYQFDKPLIPGQKVKMNFEIGYETPGFPANGTNINILENGTFINSGFLPSLGYNEGAELSSDDDRKEFGLKPKERMPKIDDKLAIMNNYISDDADWINFETTVSTSVDQYAIAPGYLQKEWVEGDRRYFHYKMDSKILNFFAWLSARYEIHRDKWNDVNIEIFYHKGHEYNIEGMVEGIKKSLDYYTENFSPYQHQQVRIIEFPRYRSFAQSFPNTIPYSEAIGFIAKVDPNDPDDLDYPLYITAHEVAHQWWAHQVIGGNVQGVTVMSETMSQYSALMVMKEKYGEDDMKRFLKYELHSYLMARGSERKKELPLILNENQGYIHYKKGSVVMYALQDYISEDSVNKAMRKYIKAVAFQEPPYTTSLEFLSYIKEVTPDSLKYIIEDMFETITLYENKTESATYREIDSTTFEVELKINGQKFRSDSLGYDKEIEMDDWIDVGVIGMNRKGRETSDTTLYLKKHKIQKGENTFKILVHQKPSTAGVDPYNKLIDRHLDDNTIRVKQED